MWRRDGSERPPLARLTRRPAPGRASFAIAELGRWPVVVPAQGVALALGVSVAVGLPFGVGPARTASRLDLVEALRQE